MARPRIVRTPDGGEVTLKNLSPEVADKVAALLGGSDAPEAPEPTTPAPKATGLLTNTAIGTFQDLTDGRWKLAVVRYNPNTKEASVEKISNCGSEKGDAAEKFRIEAVNTGLV